MKPPKNIFEKDLKRTVDLFPGMSIKGPPGKQYLKGILDIRNSQGEIIYSYSIEIHYSIGYPYRFPRVFEVGGDIPVGSDWHKYNDNSLCIDVEAEEILKCRRGLRVSDFIEQELIPHLANQRYRTIEGRYINEYQHGSLGVIEFYSELFGTSDKQMWINIACHVFAKNDMQRNGLCYCGSGKKYKLCHAGIDERLGLIGKVKVLEDFKNLGLL